MKRLKDLEAENTRLRRAVSDLTLDKLILHEAARETTGLSPQGSVPVRPSASIEVGASVPPQQHGPLCHAVFSKRFCTVFVPSNRDINGLVIMTARVLIYSTISDIRL